MAGPSMSPAQFAKALQMLSTDEHWRGELRKAYRPISNTAAALSREEMRKGGSRQLARAARGVRGNASASAARVRVGGMVPTSTTPMPAFAPVYGTKGPTGWLAGHYTPPGHGKTPGRSPIVPARREAFARFRNNPPWVGNNWPVGVRGQGPRGVNDALADGQERFLGEIEAAAMATLKRAFPQMR